MVMSKQPHIWLSFQRTKTLYLALCHIFYLNCIKPGVSVITS